MIVKVHKHGQKIKIGGLIVARQHPPTAKGFCFLAQDPDGMVNGVIPPAVYEKCRQAIHGAFVIVDGVLSHLPRQSGFGSAGVQ